MSLYLSGAQTDHKVSNEGVLCLSRAVADHHAPAVALGHLAAKTQINILTNNRKH